MPRCLKNNKVDALSFPLDEYNDFYQHFPNQNLKSFLGEPSNGHGSPRYLEDCVIVNAGGKWNDVPCTEKDLYGSICEAGMYQNCYMQKRKHNLKFLTIPVEPL